LAVRGGPGPLFITPKRAAGRGVNLAARAPSWQFFSRLRENRIYLRFLLVYLQFSGPVHQSRRK
jgi:hypothetical protein